MEVNEKEARELAAQIKKEVLLGTTVTVEPDELIPWCAEYHIEVHKPDVIKMMIRSASQWNERKHLLQKYERMD
jgi:hypothetical protein